MVNEADIAGAMDAVQKMFGPLDIGVNAAGIGISAPLLEQSLEQWQRVGTASISPDWFLCCKHQALQMKVRGGVIVSFISTRSPSSRARAYPPIALPRRVRRWLTRVAAMEFAPHSDSCRRRRAWG